MGSMQLVPFGASSLTELAAAFATVPNDEFSTGMKPSFAVLRIAGKVWAITKGKERVVIKDAENLPARTVEVIVLRTTAGLSNAWYEKSYNPENPVPPDCYSNFNDKPAPDAKSPQSASCATCPHAEWKMRPTSTPGEMKKSRSCGQSKRLAVANPSNLDEPMLLSIPPDSFKGWEAFVDWLKKHGLTPPAVVVKLGFDPDAVHPKLTFQPVGGVPVESIPAVLAARESDVAVAITGASRLAEEVHVEIPVVVVPPAGAAATAAATIQTVINAPVPTPATPAPTEAKDQILSDLAGLDAALQDLDFGVPA